MQCKYLPSRVKLRLRIKWDRSTKLEISRKKRGAKELGPGNSVIRLRTQKNFPLPRFFFPLVYFKLCLFHCKGLFHEISKSSIPVWFHSRVFGSRKIESPPPIAFLIRVIAPNVRGLHFSIATIAIRALL